MWIIKKDNYEYKEKKNRFDSCRNKRKTSSKMKKSFSSINVQEKVITCVQESKTQFKVDNNLNTYFSYKLIFQKIFTKSGDGYVWFMSPTFFS